MQWLNEPRNWDEQNNILTVKADPKTDFWRLTHDGLIRNNGHFYYREVEGDFTCDVTLRGDYRELYDHAGLMLRLDDKTWLKCGVELVYGVQQASAVVTREYSDWSVVTLPTTSRAVRLQLKRRGGTVVTAFALEGGPYTMLRQSYLTDVTSLQLGMMCAAPEGEGFSVTFEGFSVHTGDGENVS